MQTHVFSKCSILISSGGELFPKLFFFCRLPSFSVLSNSNQLKDQAMGYSILSVFLLFYITCRPHKFPHSPGNDVS